MSKTKYTGVYLDQYGKPYLDIQLGIDQKTGKRVRKKARKDEKGRPFSSVTAARKEATRLKAKFDSESGNTTYLLSYGGFMRKTYLPAYKASVSPQTFGTREPALKLIVDRFSDVKLQGFTVRMVQDFRNWLLTDSGYKQSYAALVFGMFRKTLDFAVEMDYLPNNVSKRVKAIPKGKAVVPFWNKREFESVISQICLDDHYEHLCFVMLWTYFMTGVRVNEGTALQWSDVDLDQKRLSVTHMLVGDSRTKYERHDYTKTVAGLRTISLDEDTVQVLRKWYLRQKQNGLAGHDDFIFTYDGAPMIKSTLMRIIHRYAKLAHVHPIQGKGLRHSHVSYLINEFNVSILVLSKRLGHSSPEITLKHYAHLYTGADREIADEMRGNIIFESPRKTLVTNFNGNQNVLRQSSAKTDAS